VLGSVFAALAPQAVLPVLRGAADLAAAEVRERWAHCRVIEALYDPGEHVRIAYVVHDDSSLSAARAWPDGDVLYIRCPVRPTMSRRGATVKVNGFDVEAYRFPNDRRLIGARKFARRDRVARMWQHWLDQDEPSLEIQTESLRRSMLRYVPEQKWIIQLHAQCRDDVADRNEKRAVSVRCADAAECRLIYQRAIALRRATSGNSQAFRITRPVALDERLGLLAMRWVWGVSFVELLRETETGTLMGRTARGLHVFHRTVLSPLPQVTVADYAASAARAVSDLGHVQPHQQTALAGLLADLSRAQPEDATVRRTIHNDFHWRQIWGKSERLAVLDLDRCAQGDPYVDVANFAIQLQMLAHRPDAGVSRAEATAWAQAFIRAWEETDRRPLDPHRLHWYMACALLNLARGMMRHLRRGWPGLAEICIEQASSLLQCRTSVEMAGR